MNPFHFGPPEALRLGVYHPPRVSRARDAAVLLCAPVAVEYQRTHYALRLLAKQLAASGFHVLRFDYLGTGDSAGEVGDGQYPIWVADVALAARELRSLSGAGTLLVGGLRLGALLALEALAAGALSARAAVLWDPVVSGAEYLDSQLSMDRAARAAMGNHAPAGGEILGMRFPPELRTAIRQASLAALIGRAALGSAALVVSERRPEFEALARGMRARWPDARELVAAEPTDWRSLDATYDARLTGPVIRLVADALEALA